MNVGIVCFTRRGSGILERLKAGLLARGYQAEAVYPLTVSLKAWTGQHFKTGGGIIFVGAAGIAVRSVAPFLMGKDRDPAVVVVDEQGRYSISLLSGHLGGANDLALSVADILGAVAVITTATDLNHKFAVDLFAKKNGLAITDFTIAKEISAAVLDEKRIGLFSDFPVVGELPPEIVMGEEQEINICITIRDDSLHKEFSGRVLRLVAPAVVLGIGCRRSITGEAIERLVGRVLGENGIDKLSAARIASIDLKKSEQGLIDFAGKHHAEFITFSAEELKQVQGSFTESEFVRQVTGVSNVCERACLCGCGGLGRLIVEKSAENGVTVAAALMDRELYF